MSIPAGVLEDLKQDEGWRESAYRDHLGYWTIGYGFLIDARKGGQLPKPIAEQWLAHLLEQKAAELDRRAPWWRDQPAEVQRALLNMAYQLGVDGLLDFKNTLFVLQTGDRKRAATMALNSKWAQQTPARAQRMAALIRGEP